MMKKNASRMQVLSVYDLPPTQAMDTLRRLRTSVLQHTHGPNARAESDDVLRKVYDLVGGRMSHLTRISRAEDLLGKPKPCVKECRCLTSLAKAEEMVEDEMHWLQAK